MCGFAHVFGCYECVIQHVTYRKTAYELMCPGKYVILVRDVFYFTFRAVSSACLQHLSC